MDTLPRLGDVTREQLRQHQGLDFIRWISCLSECNLPQTASAIFLERWPRSISREIVDRSIGLFTKSAIAPATTSDSTWAKPLMGIDSLVEGFLSIVRPQEVLGQLTGVLRAPIDTPVPVWVPSATSAASWIAEGVPKPFAALAFATATLTPAKVQIGCAVTQELLRLSQPGSEAALRDILAFQVILGVNEEFIIPTRAAVARTRPGSVTNAGTLVTTANDPVVDARAVLGALIAARPQVTNPTLIMDVTAASALIATDKHRDLTLTGGTAHGAKVIVVPAAGKTIAALDPSALLLWDLGLEIAVSKNASPVMDSAPASDATAVPVSMWQTNQATLRAERFTSWKLVAAAACQYATRA